MRGEHPREHRSLARDLGFTVESGGRHTGIGTDNALIVLRDGAYLELDTMVTPSITACPVAGSSG